MPSNNGQMPSRRLFVAAAVATGVLAGGARAQRPADRGGPMRLGVDRALAESGLARSLQHAFGADTGIAVLLVPAPALAVLEATRNGEVDAALVNAPAAEDALEKQGLVHDRRPIAAGEFILVGPSTDPANVAGTTDLLDAFRRIAAAKATFVSRRDRSGTNAAELRFWKAAGNDIGWIKGFWYKEVREGALASLNAAAEHDGYTLLDRGTWSGFKDRRNLVVLVEGDQRLLNQYAVVLVNPQKHPHVKAPEARAFADWLLSPECQDAIADYKVDGEQLFVPSASAGDRLETAWRSTIFADGATPYSELGTGLTDAGSFARAHPLTLVRSAVGVGGGRLDVRAFSGFIPRNARSSHSAAARLHPAAQSALPAGQWKTLCARRGGAGAGARRGHRGAADRDRGPDGGGRHHRA